MGGIYVKIHIVQKGDTLWKIAQKYGVDFEELKQLNTQLTNPDMIMPGMKIKVPSAGVPVQKKEAPIVKEAPVAPIQEAKEPYVDLSPEPLPVVKEQVKGVVSPEKPKMPYAPKLPQLNMDINNYYLNMAKQYAPETTNVFPGMVPKEQPVVSPAVDEEVPEVPKAPQLPPEAVSPLTAPEYCVPITGINPGYGFNYNPYGPAPLFGQPGFPAPQPYPPMVSPTQGQDLDDLDDMPEMPPYPGAVLGAYSQPSHFPQQLPAAGGDCGCGPQPGFGGPGYPAGAQPGFGGPGYPAGAQPGFGVPGYPVGAQPGFGGPGYPAGAQPGFGVPGYPAGAQPGFGGPGYPGQPGFGGPGYQAGAQPGYGVPSYPGSAPLSDFDDDDFPTTVAQPGFGTPGYPAGAQPGFGVPGYPAGAQPGFGTPGYPAGAHPDFGVPGYPAGVQPGFEAQGYPAGAQPGYGMPGFPAGAQPGYGVPGYQAGAQPGYGMPGYRGGVQPGYGVPGYQAGGQQGFGMPGYQTGAQPGMPQQGPLGMPDFDDDDDFNL
jgi:morphogenetic protein associated with SpoVID